MLIMGQVQKPLITSAMMKREYYLEFFHCFCRSQGDSYNGSWSQQDSDADPVQQSEISARPSVHNPQVQHGHAAPQVGHANGQAE